jgi:hypothetical protein
MQTISDDDLKRAELHEFEENEISALEYKLIAQCGKARAAELVLPHHTALTPIFMPVGTQGTVKGLTTKQLEDLDCHIILGNY